MADVTGNDLEAAAMLGIRSAQSCPLRVSSRILPPSMATRSR